MLNTKSFVMRNLLLLFALLFFNISSVSAQAFEKGTNVFHLGVGYPNIPHLLLRAETKRSPDFEVTGAGPFHFRYEHAYSSGFGVGVSVNSNVYGATWTTSDSINKVLVTYNNHIKYFSFNILLRGAKHWEVNEKIDLYIGAGTGYNFENYEEKETDITSKSERALFPIGVEATFGMNYFFTKNIGAYIEAGYAKDIVQAGIAAKF